MNNYEILKNGRMRIKGNFEFPKIEINGLEVEGTALVEVIYETQQESNKINPNKADFDIKDLVLNGNSYPEIEKINPNIVHHLYSEVMRMTNHEIEEYNRTI